MSSSVAPEQQQQQQPQSTNSFSNETNTTTGMDTTANPPSGGEPAASAGDEELPPQLHAGKVGLGPNYAMGPSATDKMTGLKEELVGSVKKDQELKQHGHDMRTGELKRRERDEDQGSSAFANAEEKPGQPQQQQQPSTESTKSGDDRGVFTEGDKPGKRVGEDRATMANP